MKRILVTGGAGFIGSHICSLLLEKGYRVIILDSFVNSSPKTIEQIRKISNLADRKRVVELEFIECDLTDLKKLKKVFRGFSKDSKPIDAIIHLAGLKSVEESIREPIRYWDNNVTGTINLIKAMKIINCTRIVFSSSATIYGQKNSKLLIKENSSIHPNNVYGETKHVIERILESLKEISLNNYWSIVILRYFNPIGAHPSSLIGENPLVKPTNIMPLINDVALGRKDYLEIYGNDWDTPDGTCIRDYIHVMDLAEGHLKSLEYILNCKPEILKLNLGTGQGVSVLELLDTFQESNNIKVPFKYVKRREGDISFSVADNSYAKRKINWEPIFDLKTMCKDSWNWFSRKSKLKR